jgi:MFS family permease
VKTSCSAVACSRSPRCKTGVFVLEGLNAFATSLYFNYLFFLMRADHGFTNLGNLTLCALTGLVYAVGCLYAGRYAQRHGYFVAFRLGLAVMGVALLVAGAARSVAGQVLMMVLWTFGMCFTWPSLEALTSEHEPPLRLQRLIGIYNLVWATAAGLAYFAGGVMLEKLGAWSVLYVPVAIHAIQWTFARALERRAHRDAQDLAPAPEANGAAPAAVERSRSPLSPKWFLKMAWVANPFAYMAMNALIPVIPRLAERFNLSPAEAGFCCSVWFFARAASFLLLWLWTGWHYRFGWLASAYAAMTASFVVILTGPSLWVLVAGQVVFGLAVGLIYYSSLYYSMDVGETKGEHGGIHEAALGVGVCAGPAVGALSLYFFPQLPNMNAWAVTAFLAAGLGLLLCLRRGRSAPD